MKLQIRDIIKAVSAEMKQNLDKEINGVEFDARKIKPGNLFVPMKGNRDGQEFIGQAIDNGAVAVFYEDDQYYSDQVISIKVNDTLQAFQKLAQYYLELVNPKVVAITGSNGKTTTKDMTYAVANTTYRAYKTNGNYNNNIGMPYTILHMPIETEVLVLEMGMDNFNQISQLSKIAHPDLAAITLIGESHMENLGSKDGIARAKLEILDGMSDDDILIIPGDEELLTSKTEQLALTVKTIGFTNSNDLYATDINVEKDKTTFKLNLDDGVWSIPVIGDYNVSNAMIAISLGMQMGIPLAKIKEGLSTFSLTNQRTEWKKRLNGAEILSDVYNANPTAMKKVLINFANLTTDKKKIAVLGDMLELGNDEIALHKDISKCLIPDKIEYVFLYGTLMESLYDELKKVYESNKIFYYPLENRKHLIKDLDEFLTSDTISVFKGSNSMKLADVIDELISE